MEQIHIGDERTRSIDAMCDMTTLEKELDKEFEVQKDIAAEFSPAVE